MFIIIKVKAWKPVCKIIIARPFFQVIELYFSGIDPKITIFMDGSKLFSIMHPYRVVEGYLLVFIFYNYSTSKKLKQYPANWTLITLAFCSNFWMDLKHIFFKYKSILIELQQFILKIWNDFPVYD